MDPDRTALRILELRAYARTKQQIDTARKAQDFPHGPMADLVGQIMTDQFREQRARHGR